MNMADDGEETYLDLPDYQVFDPDLGPLEKRVQRSYTEAVKDDIVDLRETEYWFTTPESGWNSVPVRVRYMAEDPEPAFPQPYHARNTEQGADRIAYTELDEGKVYLGVITDVWLYHGVQVDIGAEFDVLIPCTEELWEVAVDYINVGEPVLIEIHKMRMPGLYRWPIQAKFCEPVLQDLMMHPDDYECPVDHGWAAEAGWSAEEVAAATGRTLEATTYFVPPDDNELAVKVQDGYGTGIMPWRDENSPPIEDYIDDPLDNPEDDAVLGRGRANVAAAIKSLNYSP